MINVTLYYRPGDPESQKIVEILKSMESSIPHQTILIDIDSDIALQEMYKDSIPLIEVGPYRLQSPISQQQLTVALGAARDRMEHLEKIGDDDFRKRVQRGKTVTSMDRVTYWLSNHYMILFNLFLAMYVGLPFLAPILIKTGNEAPAKIIYSVYSNLCHQLAFRSFFLFGEQPYYPRQLADIQGVESFEQVTGINPLDLNAARSFIGNEKIGFKVALCERDIAIYAAMLLFGMVFAATGKRFKTIPWYIWIIFGLIPIGLDGFSQLPALLTNILPGWLPQRESTPFLRVFTGGLFGMMTAWYLYPLIEEAMRETRRMLSRKMAVITQTGVNS